MNRLEAAIHIDWRRYCCLDTERLQKGLVHHYRFAVAEPRQPLFTAKLAVARLLAAAKRKLANIIRGKVVDGNIAALQLVGYLVASLEAASENGIA